MASIKSGDPVPAVTLRLHSGEAMSLADLYRDHVVVLFFYPKDNTPVCTREACAFRDSYEKFTEAGATVVGVSSDSSESHQQFARRRRLPFMLASDEDGVLRRAFGVPRTMGLFPGRVTYVIDRDGVARNVFAAQLAADKHVQTALAAIKSLTSI